MQMRSFRQAVFFPLFSTVLKERLESFILGGVGAAQIGLVMAHLPGWPCPFKAIFGIPCPGCGLSTSIAALLHGDWQNAFSLHAFAPVFLLAVVLLLTVSLLPSPVRTRMIHWIRFVELHTGISVMLLTLLFFYWGLRLLFL